jgi:hypothetical protein
MVSSRFFECLCTSSNFGPCITMNGMQANTQVQ